MKEHEEILTQVMDSLRLGGRSRTPTLAGFDGEAKAVAENCSEAKIISATGKRYTISCIEDDS